MKTRATNDFYIFVPSDLHLRITPPFTGVMCNFSPKIYTIYRVPIGYLVNEQYETYVTDRQTDRQTNVTKTKHVHW